MLIYSIKQAFSDEKIKSIRLNTFLINVKSQRLYESIGFKLVGRYCGNDAKHRDQMCFEVKRVAADPVAHF